MDARKPGEKRDEYRAWFDKEVERGLEDVKAGRLVSNDEVREHILKRRLNRVKTRKKAA